MEQRDHFIHLFKYNDWATRLCIESIKKPKKKIDKAEELLSHIISAQRIWLNRILGKDIQLDPWDKHSLEECMQLSTEITAEWINYLEGMGDTDVDKRIEYKNTKGDKFSNAIKDMIVQVINHSTYHRAQIAMLVRQAGGEPAKTDYIIYQRSLGT